MPHEPKGHEEGIVKYIEIPPAGVAFYKAIAAEAKRQADEEAAKGMVTFLRAITYRGQDIPEWEAHCVDWRLPSRLEAVVGSADGPLDALHGLKHALHEMGYQNTRLHLTNIERIYFVLHD